MRGGRPYSKRMAEVVASIASRGRGRAAGARSCSTGTGKDETHLIIVATGDRGLAGAFNTNIVRAARKKAEELDADGKTVLFYIVGRKGRPVIQRFYPKAIIAQHDTSEMKAPTYADAQAIAKDIVDRFDTDGIRRRPPRLRQFQVDPGPGAGGRADHPGRPPSAATSRQDGRRRRAAVEYRARRGRNPRRSAAAQHRGPDLSRAAREPGRLLRHRR